MSEPNKHHYLPVFYLNRWAQADGRLTRFSRPHRAVVASPIAPKYTGFEPHLYRLDGHSPETANIIESQFMNAVVDSPAAIALTTLISREQSKLTIQQRQAWVLFVKSLHVRNPEKVEHLIQQAKRGLTEALAESPEAYQAIRQLHHPSTLVEWAEQDAPELLTNFGKHLLPGIITHKPTAQAILHMRWWTVSIPTDAPDLLTCDRPVYMSHGVMDAQCLIALPISPRDVFFACRSEEIFNRVMKPGLSRLAKAINESMVFQAEKNVYGAHAQHLRFVENRLRVHDRS